LGSSAAQARSGLDLLALRILELGIHARDLAWAIDGDETLAEGLVAFMWSLSAALDRGGREGFYSAAQDPAAPEDGPLQARLLWRTGRRLVPPSRRSDP